MINYVMLCYVVVVHDLIYWLCSRVKCIFFIILLFVVLFRFSCEWVVM